MLDQRTSIFNKDIQEGPKPPKALTYVWDFEVLIDVDPPMTR
jgi:hypothetical protein